MSEVYDVVIIGGGITGLSAGIYTTRAKLKTVLVERSVFGGQIINADVIENYPGFPNGVIGGDTGELFNSIGNPSEPERVVQFPECVP